MIPKVLSIVLGITLAFAFVAVVPTARASDQDEATQLTFDQPVQLPDNVVLPAGTYWFVVPDLIKGGNLVQVYSADWSSLYATVRSRDARRTTTNMNAQLTLAEQSPRQPMALLSLFYPDRAVGHEFVYSGQEERKFSETNHITVTAQPGPQVNGG